MAGQRICAVRWALWSRAGSREQNTKDERNSAGRAGESSESESKSRN